MYNFYTFLKNSKPVLITSYFVLNKVCPPRSAKLEVSNH